MPISLKIFNWGSSYEDNYQVEGIRKANARPEVIIFIADHDHEIW